MKWQALLIALWTTVSHGQYLMQMPFGNTQRPPLVGTMRLRGSVPMVAYPRWASASNQIPIQQRPYKHPYMFVKPSPYMFRTPKPIGKYPPMFGYWKTPGFRPQLMKDAFRSPLPAQLGLNQLGATPTSAQKLYAASSPVKSVLFSASPTKNIFAAGYKPYTPSFAPIVQSTQPTLNFVKSQPLIQTSQLHQASQPQQVIQQQTSQPLVVGPVTTTPASTFSYPVKVESYTSYPIKVEGEGGPIHTIPAPNLSSNQNPIISDYSKYLENHSKKIKAGHKYEVTEETNEKPYHEQSLKTSMKISPPANYFSSLSQSQFLPQPAALHQAQPSGASLTSQELYNLLSDPTPQQQNFIDVYSYASPQPQLQQHYSQQILFNSHKPVQPYSAVFRPSQMTQESVLYRHDPRYAEKFSERFLGRTTHRLPPYRPPNPPKPYSQLLSITDEDKIKMEIQQALQDDLDLETVHSNIIRNTYEATQNDSDSSASYLDNQVDFKPISYNGSLLAAIDDIASSSITPDYIKSLQNVDASSEDRTEKVDSRLEVDFLSNMRPYFIQNEEAESKQYFSDFTPNQGVVFHDDEEKNDVESNAPMRIYVPDTFEEDDHPTENIQVSASMNANGGSKDMMIVFGTSDNSVQYDELYQEPHFNETKSDSTADQDASPSKEASDIIVGRPQNNTGATGPTLDILTKDWKTSIVIKPGGKIESTVNQVGEFGNRIVHKD